MKNVKKKKRIIITFKLSSRLWQKRGIGYDTIMQFIGNISLENQAIKGLKSSKFAQYEKLNLVKSQKCPNRKEEIRNEKIKDEMEKKYDKKQIKKKRKNSTKKCKKDAIGISGKVVQTPMWPYQYLFGKRTMSLFNIKTKVVIKGEFWSSEVV